MPGKQHTYEVFVTEHRVAIVPVKAHSEREARSTAQALYRAGKLTFENESIDPADWVIDDRGEDPGQ